MLAFHNGRLPIDSLHVLELKIKDRLFRKTPIKKNLTFLLISFTHAFQL